MRQRRSDRGVPAARRAAALIACAAVTLGARQLTAQPSSGTIFLLLPMAARAVGVGGATVANAAGGEAVLSNPAAVAWLTRPEGTLNYAKDFSASRLLATVVLPQHKLGTFAFTASYVDLGVQEATQGEDATTGQIIPRSLTASASYAASFGRALSAGVTYEFLQTRYDCTGLCENPSDPTNTRIAPTTAGAVDAGLQYDLTGHAPVRLGVAVRHAGPKVQVEDREQSDPLPTEGSFGARVDVPSVARSVKDAELHLLGEVATGLAGSGLETELRLGAEAVYRKSFALRAGFSHGRGGESGGPAVGFGYVGKRFAFDLATQFAGLSIDAGVQPTFVAFRYWF